MFRPVPAIAAVILSVIAACGGGTTVAPSLPTLPPSAEPGACLPAPTIDELGDWGPPSSQPPVVPVIISSDQVCGENRFLFGLLGADNVPMAAPDRAVSVRFFDLGRDPNHAVATADGEFIWAIDDQVGVYSLTVDLTSVGLWGAEFATTDASGAIATVRLTFDVKAHGRAVQVGERAPKSESRTLDDVGGDLARISTDQNPVERFYTTSIAEAVTAREPFILAFATPAFCTSGQCGPTLERVKPVAAAHPKVTVVVVEPYELKFKDGALQPALDANGGLVPVSSVVEWGLPSEPWIYVIDTDGVVRASFEGIVSEAELEAAVSAVE